MTTDPEQVVAGVDTHADTHHAAVLDLAGRRLADASFPATGAGYAALTAFIQSFGSVKRIGVEGTGSYGSGLARHLADEGLIVREVIRPNRQDRRRNGKSDPEDAYSAARAALADDDLPQPKAHDGQVEQLRAVFIARRSAVKARTAALSQLKGLLVTAPESIRARHRKQSDQRLLDQLAKSRAALDDADGGLRMALRSIARRIQTLNTEIRALEADLATLARGINPALLATKGVGPVSAAQLLIAAGDNPERLRSKAAFAALCGASPISASSGKIQRHRLNRGGDRQANSALHRIVLVRMSFDPRTRAYVQRRRTEGLSTREIIRCLRRYVADETFTLITDPPAVPVVDDLRPLREARGITIPQAARQLGVWPAHVSQVERGERRDDTFATNYRDWLKTA
jgi:transposase